MKKILSLIVAIVLTATAAISQAPGIFNYQGVARNSVGNVLVNKTITLRLTIHDVSAAGPVVYQESRTVTTNPFGLFNAQVGSAGATGVTGTITGVPWGVGAKFIQVEIDPNAGSSFINIGTAQLASVPYSLFASSSGDFVLPFNKTQADAGTLFRINNSGTGISGAIMGTTLSNAGNAWGVHGRVDNTSAGASSTGVLGTNLSTSSLGIGVTGSQNGSGWGVYGTTPSGIGVNGGSASGTGVFGSSTSGTGVLGTSSTGIAGQFVNSNAANSGDILFATSNGSGSTFDAKNTGTGRAGTFEVNNPANASAVLFAVGNGTNSVGYFINTNAAATTPTLVGTTNGTNGNHFAIQGEITSTTPGGFSAGVRGINNGTGGLGIGVWGSHSGSGWGVYGTATGGIGVNGSASSGIGVNGTSNTGTGGRFTTTSGLALHTTGGVRLQGIGEAANRLLTSDATGNATWQDAATAGLVTGSGTIDFLPKWTPSGTNLGNSQLFDNGTNIGLSTITPAARLDIANAGATSKGLQVVNSVATNNSSAIYAQTNNITSTSFFEGSALTGVMPLNVATTMLSGASTIKGIASTNAAVSQFSGIGVQGASAAGYGVIGNSNSGVGLAGIAWGTGYGLYTFGKVQIEGQGAGLNKLLRSDANGNATWETLTSIGGVSGTGTTNFVPKWTPNGTTLGNSMAFDNGVAFSIGSTTPTTDMLYVSNAAANTFATINQVGTNVGGLSFSRANAYKYDIAINAANDLYIQNYTSGSTAFTIRGANSNVGINQINPTAKLDVNGTFKLTDGTQGANKVLTSDAAGNASWQNLSGSLTMFSSAWLPPSDPPSRDSSIDGTLTKVYVVLAPEITPAVIATGNISVYFRVGPVGPYELPYISNAGGRANAVQAVLVPGKIIITRPTFNETAPNNINLPATLEFRYTIIQ